MSTGPMVNPTLEALLERVRSTYRLCPATMGLSSRSHQNCADCMGEPCARMLARGLDDNGAALAYVLRPPCGATNRQGKPCGNRVIPGKTRCWLHGGASTGPTTAEGRARIAEAQRQRWRRWRG